MEKPHAEMLHVEDPVEKAIDLEVQKPQTMSETAYVNEAADTEKTKKSAAERKLLWKADLTIIPMAGLIYLVAYLVSPSALRSFSSASATPDRQFGLTAAYCYL